MEGYKKKYTDVQLKLFAPDKKLKGVLNTGNNNIVFDMKKSEKENETTELTFSTIFDNKLLNYKSCEDLLQIYGENDYYIIKEVEISSQDSNVINIVAYSEPEELKGVFLQYFKEIGKSPEVLFNAIKSNVKSCEIDYYWKGTDIANKNRYLECEDGDTAFSALLKLAENFSATVEFSTDDTGKKYVYLRENPINNGRFLIKDRDLQGVSIKYTTTNIITRMHGFGANDTDTGNAITIMPVNPTGKSYLQNTGYFKDKGLSDEYINKTPRCLQEGVYNNDILIDSQDLYNETKEDLAKYCVPVVEGSITACDLGIKEVTSLSELKVNEEVMVIDMICNLKVSARITSIDRNFTDNPLDTNISISNLKDYSNVAKDLIHSGDKVDSITSTDENGTYVPAEKVVVTEKDTGDHVNVTKKLGSHQTLITQNAYEIKLTAENLEKSKAEIKVTTDAISLDVTNFKNDTSAKFEVQAGQIQSTVNGLNGAKSQITQLSNEISSKVDEGEFGTLIKQNSSAVAIAIHGETDNSVTVDSNGLTVIDGGFRYKNSDGSTILEARTSNTLTLGDSTWSMSRAMERVYLGGQPLGSYFILSNIRVDSELDMKTYDVNFTGKNAGLSFDEGGIYGLWNGYGVHANTSFACDGHFKAYGDIDCTGAKDCLQSTENYGDRRISAYETAEYYFGDIGSGFINSDEECIVFIDDIFRECVNTDITYQVFTQCYDGNITKIKRFPNYFVVYGKIGTEFGWELKAKRKKWENTRLEMPNIENTSVNETIKKLSEG